MLLSHLRLHLRKSDLKKFLLIEAQPATGMETQEKAMSGAKSARMGEGSRQELP